MEKNSRNLINSKSVPRLPITDSHNKIKIKPIKIYKRNKIIFNYPAILKKNNSRKEISSSLFQDNEVSLVRNLNINEEKNFCGSKIYKETLQKNRLNEGDNLGKSNKKVVNLPKIKVMTTNNIIESEKRLNENKKINIANMANNLLEKELYENIKDVRIKIKQLKSKKNELYKDYDAKTKEMKDINMEIEATKVIHGQTFLSKLFDLKSTSSLASSRIDSGKKIREQLTESQNELRNVSKKNLPDKKNNPNTTKEIKNIWNNNKYEDKIKKVKILYAVKKERDEEMNEKLKKIEQLKENLKLIESDINVLNKDLLKFRTQENEIIEKLMRHYEALLYRGKDTRNDGLTWIIRAMWNLGKNVPMQFIPTFLDFDAIDFLFRLANKTIELENKKKLLNDSKKNLMIKVHKLYFDNNNNNNKNNTNNKKDNDDFLKRIFQGSSSKSSIIFKTNIIKRNSTLKHSISQTNIVKSYIHSSVDDEQRDEEKTTFKEISKIYEKNENNMNIEKMQGMDYIEELQKKIKNIENEIVELKNKEIIRIFKQFIESDYQNKYHVSIDVVLAALVGEHMKNTEMNKFAKFKKEYYENLKTIRFFEYSKKKESK